MTIPETEEYFRFEKGVHDLITKIMRDLYNDYNWSLDCGGYRGLISDPGRGRVQRAQDATGC